MILIALHVNAPPQSCKNILIQFHKPRTLTQVTKNSYIPMPSIVNTHPSITLVKSDKKLCDLILSQLIISTTLSIINSRKCNDTTVFSGARVTN